MVNKHPFLVFCPTRDRPELLFKTLQAISYDCLKKGNYFPEAVIIIDDSIHKQNQVINRKITQRKKDLKIIYHGREEQRLVIQWLCSKLAISIHHLKIFIRALGSKAWDLGAIRNYILLLAVGWEIKNIIVVMIDDDILLSTPDLDSRRIKGVLSHVIEVTSRDNSYIVGVNLYGYPDISTLERIFLGFNQKLGINCFKLPKRTIHISAGVIAFTAWWAAKMPFPRTYNEDWLWLRRCSTLGAHLIQTNPRAYHCQSTMPLVSRKLLYRESLGEAFFEGWDWAYHNYRNPKYCYTVLRKESYWVDVIQEELNYLEKIKGIFIEGAKYCQKNRIQKQLQQTHCIIDKAYSIIKTIQAKKMIRLTNDYIMNTFLWRKIAKKIQKINTPLSKEIYRLSI